MINLGLLFALASSVFKSSKSITTKIGATNTDSYLTSWATRTFSLPILLPAALIAGVTVLPLDQSPSYWALAIGKGILTAATTILLAQAMRESELSLVSPLMSFVPIVVAVPSFIVLGEVPSPLAGLGLVFVVIGSYLLNVHSVDDGLFEPFRLLLTDSAAKYVFAALAIIAVTPTMDKLGIQASTPLTWVFLTHVVSVVVLSVVVVFASEQPTQSFSNNWKVLIAVGVFSSMIWVLQSYAYTYTQVAYVQAVKRTSVFFSVIASGYLFDEAFTAQRLIAGGMIVAGVIAVIAGA